MKIGFQTGYAFSLSVDQGDKGFMGFFPIKGYLLMGKTKHFLETGLGLKITGIPYPDFNLVYGLNPSVKDLVFGLDIQVWHLVMDSIA